MTTQHLNREVEAAVAEKRLTKLRASASVKVAFVEMLVTLAAPLSMAVIATIALQPPAFAWWVLGAMGVTLAPLWCVVRYLEFRLARRQLANTDNQGGGA